MAGAQLDRCQDEIKRLRWLGIVAPRIRSKLAALLVNWLKLA